ALELAIGHGDQIEASILNISHDGEIIHRDLLEGLSAVSSLHILIRMPIVRNLVDIELGLFLALIIIISGLGQVGVDDGNVYLVLICVQIDLSQHAVASSAHTLGVGADHVAGGKIGITKDALLTLTINGDG